MLNCYPIIFCGRSFVSPNNGAPDNGGNSLLYDTVPTLPGYFDERIADLHGADTGAIMWHDVPNAFVEARSLLHHRALPLWNRYKNAGDPLLTQGISMFGDPLHFIVLAGGGSAWAWDCKFLAAKWLFCFGCGWLVLNLTRRLRLALLFTVASAYCGVFHFIPNHPGFFVFCYSPWILLSVMRALMESGPRRIAWGLLWLIVNTGCFNAGHIEAAVVCIGGLNLTGLIYVLTETSGARWRAIGAMAALTALFAGLNAPVWVPFLSYLPDSFNLHTDVVIEQFPFFLIAGLFDDRFYQAVQDGPLAQGPGGTVFVLFGLLFALAGFRELRREKFFFINLAALVVWGGFVFGYIPAALVEHLPLIRGIGHIRADFSYLMIIQSLIGSAYGWLALVRLSEAGAVWRRWAVAACGLVLVELLFFWSTRTIDKQADFHVYVAIVTFCVLVAPPMYLLCRQTVGARRFASQIALGVLLFLPHARFGLYTFGPDRWLLQPGSRARLDFPSEAVESMKRGAREPFRVTGLAWDLYAGYGAAYGLEDIKGVSALMNRDYMELCTHYPGVERDYYLIELPDPAAAKNLLSMLNVRYLVLNPNDPPPDDLPYRLTGKYDLTVFENDTVWPRAFFVNKIRTYQGVDDFVSLLEQYGERPFAAISEADLRRHPALRALAESPAAMTARPASGYRLGANETSFEIEAQTSGLALVSETYVADGFTVEVNGVAGEVLRLNHAFKGVFLDRPGHYRVTFRYAPPHWVLASAMFLAALALIGAGAVVMIRGDRSCRKPSVRAPGPERDAGE
jgi:hypothetical protein